MLSDGGVMALTLKPLTATQITLYTGIRTTTLKHTLCPLNIPGYVTQSVN